MAVDIATMNLVAIEKVGTGETIVDKSQKKKTNLYHTRLEPN